MLTMNQRGLVRTAVSSTEPITLNDAKLYLRVTTTSDDALITDLITVVREHAEGYLRRSIIDQDWRLTLDDYAPLRFRLPMGQVRSITSVKTIDSDGNEATVATSLYALQPDRDELELDEIIYAHHVQISYETGYASASDVPKSMRYGMLSHLAKLYDCRGEGDQAIPADAMALYAAHREVLL